MLYSDAFDEPAYEPPKGYYLWYDKLTGDESRLLFDKGELTRVRQAPTLPLPCFSNKNGGSSPFSRKVITWQSCRCDASQDKPCEVCIAKYGIGTEHFDYWKVVAHPDQPGGWKETPTHFGVMTVKSVSVCHINELYDRHHEDVGWCIVPMRKAAWREAKFDKSFKYYCVVQKLLLRPLR